MANEPAKKVINWNGLPINVTALAGDRRFAFGPKMRCDYGCIRGTYGQAQDGRALDVYVAGGANTVHRIYQIKPGGQLDEHKYVLGAPDLMSAKQIFLDHVPANRFGGIQPYSLDKLKQKVGIKSG